MRVMMKRLVVVLGVCGLALPLWLQAAAAPAQQCKDPGSTMLWQVQAPAGKGQREVSLRIRVQSESAVREFGLLAYPYMASFESLDVVYVRVRKPDGSVVEIKWPHISVATLRLQE